jgi:hypothetical protein
MKKFPARGLEVKRPQLVVVPCSIDIVPEIATAKEIG